MPGDAQLISALMQTAGQKKLPLPVTLKLANRCDITSSVGFIHIKHFLFILEPLIHPLSPFCYPLATLVSVCSGSWQESREMYFPK